MATKRGGDTVTGGYYWNLREWDATFVAGPEGELPGSSNEIYRELPALGLLLAAPIMGALFVMFLPFIGIALLLQHITRAAIQAAGDTLEPVLRSVTAGRQTGVAVLAGKTSSRQHAEETTTGREPGASGTQTGDERKDRR
jgi:hypothetical protein